MYKIIPFIITVVAALVLKILYDANTFSIIRYKSILTNCTNIKGVKLLRPISPVSPPHSN